MGRELLRQHYSEAGSYLRDKADDNWRTFLDKAALCDKSGGFSYTLREHAPHSEMAMGVTVPATLVARADKVIE